MHCVTGRQHVWLKTLENRLLPRPKRSIAIESAYYVTDQGFSIQLVISRKSYKETIG